MPIYVYRTTQLAEFMKSYAHKFSECSFRLKPCKIKI